MSSRYETIDNGCWADFDDVDLSMPATLLYIWTWANPKCGMAGLYRVSRTAMAESRVPLDAIEGALAELERHRFVFYREGWLFVRARVKRLGSMGGSARVGSSIAKDVKRCPVNALRDLFLDEYLDSGSVPRSSWRLDEALDEHLGDYIAERVNRRSGDGPETVQDASPEAEKQTLSGPSLEGADADADVVPLPSSTTQGEEETRASARTRSRAKTVDQAALPDDFPDELRDRVEPVLSTLRRVYEARGGYAPTLRGVGLALTRYPERDHVAVAANLEHWATAGRGLRQTTQTKDWVATFRTFLSKEPAGAPARSGSTNGASHRLANSGDEARFDDL